MITPLNKHGDLNSIKLVLARRKALVIFERSLSESLPHHQEQATSHFCAGFCGDVKLSSEQHTAVSVRTSSRRHKQANQRIFTLFHCNHQETTGVTVVVASAQGWPSSESVCQSPPCYFMDS